MLAFRVCNRNFWTALAPNTLSFWLVSMTYVRAFGRLIINNSDLLPEAFYIT